EEMLEQILRLGGDAVEAALEGIGRARFGPRPGAPTNLLRNWRQNAHRPSEPRLSRCFTLVFPRRHPDAMPPHKKSSIKPNQKPVSWLGSGGPKPRKSFYDGRCLDGHFGSHLYGSVGLSDRRPRAFLARRSRGHFDPHATGELACR